MPRYDFSAVGLDGDVRAVIEAKGRLGTSAVWAAGFRRNLMSHAPFPATAMFLVVTPDRLYVWRPGLPPDAEPSVELSTSMILGPYFDRVGVTAASIEPEAFELLVSWWLNDLSQSVSPTMKEQLEGTGIADALAGARLEHEAA
jgi:hypothetical protein